MKKIIFLILCLLPLTQQIAGFNFSEELRKTYTMTKPLDLINAYQNVAQNIDPNDSIRLSKKFIRMIKTLHQVCCDHEDPQVRLAFKRLLFTSLENQNLQSVDHGQELAAISKIYQPIVQLSTSITEQQAKPSAPIVPERKAEKPKELHPARGVLAEKLKDLKRQDIAYTLLLRQLVTQIGYIKEELKSLQKDVGQMSKQTPTITLMHKKLARIEAVIDNHKQLIPMRSIAIEDNNPNELDDVILDLAECSPLLRKLIEEEMD